MNILYRACGSKNGYQSRVLERMFKKGLFEKCVVITQTLDGKDYYPEDHYVDISAGYGYNCTYEEICDFESLPALSEELLKALLIYKDNAMNMTGRYYNRHIYSYEEMEADYLKHARFWNYLLDKERIGFVFMTVIPHTPWEYIIYALSKVKGIPTLLETISNVEGLHVVGTSIEKLGANVKMVYEKGNGKPFDMDKRLYSSYLSVKENDGRVTSQYYYAPDDHKKHREDYQKWLYEVFLKKMYYLRSSSRKRIIKDIVKLRFDKLKMDVEDYLDNEYVIKKYSLIGKRNRKLEYYESRTVSPDFNDKYIFYALHMTPEASTLPYSGVFANQILAVRILAQAAEKCGLKVYVKEHYMQISRNRIFYEELERLPNVFLISSDENTLALIDNAVAVSSLTGTCMIEGIVRGKPALGFVDFYLRNAPGFFKVSSVEDTVLAIRDIIEGNYSISESDSYYFYSVLGKTLVRSYLDYPDYEKTLYKENECMDDVVDLIEQFVKSGLSDDFCYFRNENN